MSRTHRRDCRTSKLWQMKPEFFTAREVDDAWSEALARRGRPGRPDTFNVYVHFPYCTSHCTYCQYWSLPLARDVDLDSHLEGLICSIESVHALSGFLDVSHGYLGGGTPSLARVGPLDRFLTTFHETFDIEGQFTFEANPSSLDAAKIDSLARHGVNRVSLGVQSCNAAILQQVNRSNPPLDVLRHLVHHAKGHGILVNLDLILGLPGQTPGAFLEDLFRLVELRPDSIVINRFQPTSDLPHEPPVHMRYGAVLDRRRVWQRLARNGYIFVPSGVGRSGDGAYSRVLMRVRSRRVIRQQLEVLRRAVPRRFLRGQSIVRGYQSFDNPFTLLMGIGTGSFSHVHGLGWYRDVTPLGSTERVLLGTRLSPFEECLSSAMPGLMHGRWVSSRTLERDHGAVVTKVIEMFEKGVRAGAVQKKADRFRLDPRAPDSVRDELLDALMPETSPTHFAIDRKVQADLLPVTDSDDDPRIVMAKWSNVVGLESPGNEILGAIVVGVDGKVITFRLPGAAPEQVDVQIEPASVTNCTGRSRRFGLTWIPRHEQTMSDDGKQFLRLLIERTKTRDP